MAMNKVIFTDTTVVKQPYVEINGVEHEVQDGEYSGGTDLNAETFNEFQNNIDAMFTGNNAMGTIVVDDIKSKNILPNKGQTTTKNGLTITVNKDKSITFNGTATATTFYYILENEELLIPSGQYCLSFHKKGSINGTTLFSFWDENKTSAFIHDVPLATTNSRTATATTDLTLYHALFYIVKGCVFDNYTIYPMLEKGSVATDYVEHKEYGNSGDNNNVYSTEEQVVGTWVDGRPIYRKTLVGLSPISSGDSIAHGVANIGTHRVVKECEFWYNDNMWGQTYNDVSNFAFVEGIDASLVKFILGTGWNGLFIPIVTIEYTKTTDIATIELEPTSFALPRNTAQIENEEI